MDSVKLALLLSKHLTTHHLDTYHACLAFCCHLLSSVVI